MTREEQIREALDLLAPPQRRRNECRRDIEHALNLVESRSQAAHTFKILRSKKEKASVLSYLKDLQHLKTSYGRLGASKPWFSLSETAFIAGQPTVIDREIAKAELFLAKPSPPPQPEAIRAKAAAAVANSLLAWWGHKASVTRGGKWEKLAIILAGGRAAVFEHMRAFKKIPNPPIMEKLKGKTGTALVLRPRPEPGAK